MAAGDGPVFERFFAYLSALQSWILIRIDSMALFRASKFLAVPWYGVKYFAITSVSGAKLHNPTSRMIRGHALKLALRDGCRA
jgi:hypothetical protein